jgi:hypothetical protein
MKGKTGHVLPGGKGYNADPVTEPSKRPCLFVNPHMAAALGEERFRDYHENPEFSFYHDKRLQIL